MFNFQESNDEKLSLTLRSYRSYRLRLEVIAALDNSK